MLRRGYIIDNAALRSAGPAPMRCAVLAALLFQPYDAPIPAPGAGALWVLVGLLLAVAAFSIGIGYWLWRRGRGELRSSDRDVIALSADPSAESHVARMGDQRSPDRADRGEAYQPGLPGHRPGAPGNAR